MTATTHVVNRTTHAQNFKFLNVIILWDGKLLKSVISSKYMDCKYMQKNCKYRDCTIASLVRNTRSVFTLYHRRLRINSCAPQWWAGHSLPYPLLLLLLLLWIPHLPLCLWLSLCPNSWVELVGLSPLSASTHITSFKEIHKISLLSKTIDFLTIKAISTKIIESLTRCLWKVGDWKLLTLFCQIH